MSDFKFDQDSRLDPPTEREFDPEWTLDDMEAAKEGFFRKVEQAEGDFRSGAISFPTLCERVYREAAEWAAMREAFRMAYDDAGVRMPPGSY